MQLRSLLAARDASHGAVRTAQRVPVLQEAAMPAQDSASTARDLLSGRSQPLREILGRVGEVATSRRSFPQRTGSCRAHHQRCWETPQNRPGKNVFQEKLELAKGAPFLASLARSGNLIRVIALQTAHALLQSFTRRIAIVLGPRRSKAAEKETPRSPLNI